MTSSLKNFQHPVRMFRLSDATCHAHLILLELLILIARGKEYKAPHRATRPLPVSFRQIFSSASYGIDTQLIEIIINQNLFIHSYQISWQLCPIVQITLIIQIQILWNMQGAFRLTRRHLQFHVLLHEPSTHLPWFDHTNIIWWKRLITKLFIV